MAKTCSVFPFLLEASRDILAFLLLQAQTVLLDKSTKGSSPLLLAQSIQYLGHSFTECTGFKLITHEFWTTPFAEQQMSLL